MRRSLRLTAAAALAIAVVAAPVARASEQASPARGPLPPKGFWVAGDLHVHTIYGHDTCITASTAWDPTKASRAARRPCEDTYTLGYAPKDRLQEGLDRGLNFVALTDHNNVLNQTDPAVIAWRKAHPQFVVVPGYENSQPGHVQMLGARSCYGNRGALHQVIECDTAVADKTATGERAMANGLRRDGGVFQINHPSDMNWLKAFGHSVVPDTVEVWNIGPWAFQSPLPSSNDNDFSLDWYDGFLRAGAQVGVTGGSDSHWQSTDTVQGVGDPTTWVYVTDRSVKAVLAGLRAHRTFVSDLPPAEHGAQLLLDADHDGDGTFEAIPGSQTAAGSTYRIRTVNAPPNAVLRIVTDTGSTQISLGAATSYTFRPGANGVPHAAKYVRAELLAPDVRELRAAGCDPVVGKGTTLCRDDLAMESLTSPIYIR